MEWQDVIPSWDRALDPKTEKLPSQTLFAHRTLPLCQERVLYFCRWVWNLQRTSHSAGRYGHCCSTQCFKPPRASPVSSLEKQKQQHYQPVWCEHLRAQSRKAPSNLCSSALSISGAWAAQESTLFFRGNKTSELHTGLLHSFSS